MGMIDYIRNASRERLVVGDTPKWIANSKRRAYITRVVLSAPPWVDRRALRAIQAEAQFLTQTTGVLHTVDHRVPLSHPRVCGLTVPWNLRVVPYTVNFSKGNDWCPEQEEMF